MQWKHRIIDVNLKAYCDNFRHDILLRKAVGRVNDQQAWRLAKLILKVGGERGIL